MVSIKTPDGQDAFSFFDLLKNQYKGQPIRRFVYQRSFAGLNGMYAIKHPHIALHRLWQDIVSSVKTSRQRKKHHFSRGDVWSFCDVNARAQAYALGVLLDNLHGYPSSLVVDRELSEVNYHTLPLPDKARADEADKIASETWRNILATMRDGWLAFTEMEELEMREGGIEEYRKRRAVMQQRFDDGIALYVRYYADLWD